MTPDPNPRQPRFARDIVRASAVLAVAVLTVTVVSAARSGFHASAAGINAGTLQVQVPPPDPNAGQPLLSGVQTTPFALVPPAGAACTGDSATGGYRVNSYIVPASVDPGTLQWGATGPTPAGTGANLSEPLFSSSNSPFVNMTTAVSTGQLTGLPPFSFGVFGASGPAVVPLRQLDTNVTPKVSLRDISLSYKTTSGSVVIAFAGSALKASRGYFCPCK
jgi:hypothetical protein